jgi:ParB family chromosome partitioning protein
MFEIDSCPIKQIDLQKIDIKDTLYQISIQNNFSLLCQSIQQMGVMHPPVLQEKALKFRIISGFQRVLACKEIGMKKISSCVVSSDILDHDCARWAVADNAAQRRLSPLEQSRALTLLEKTLPENLTIDEIAKQMGLPATTKAIQLIYPLCHMASHIQKGIASEYIAIPIAHALTRFSEKDALCFTQFLEELRAGVNIQRELLTTCDEIAKRDNKTITDILGSETTRTIMAQYEDDRKQRIYYIREYLKALRYPNYSAMKNKVESRMNQLKLNNRTQLVPPPYFESDIWHLHIKFKNIKEMNDLVSDILSKANAINTIIKQDIYL